MMEENKMRTYFGVILALIFPLLSFAITTDIQKIYHTSRKQKFIINYNFDKLELTDGPTIGGVTHQNIKVRGNFLHAKPGTPNIPVITKYIAIPKGSKVHTKVLRSKKLHISGVRIAPAPQILNDLNTEAMRIEKDPTVYSYNKNYPNQPIDSSTTNLRGVELYQVAVNVGQHNPVQETYTYYKELSLEVEVSSRHDAIGDQRLRSRWWDPIIADIIENPSDLPPILPKQISNKTDQDFEYLIIIPPSKVFKKYANKLKQWRTLQGIRTGIVTTQEIGGNNTQSIEKYINNAYINWKIPPAAVLLIGDYGEDDQTIISPIFNKYCLSDNIYADVTGDDLPDIVFARMTARTEQDLKNMIGKVINFEKNPPRSSNYYDRPLTAMGWELERWFQIGIEIVNGFYTNVLNKNPTRLYVHKDGAIDEWSTATNTDILIDYFGPNGLGYLPESPDYLTNWGADADDINNAINDGTFMVLHRDHGSVNGWNHPEYRTSSVKKLNNKSPTFILSMNCLTGKFDDEQDSFTEVMHRHPKGALGIISASHASNSFVNDTMMLGIYDYMWPNFLPELGKDQYSGENLMPAFAHVSGKYFLQRSSWPKTDRTKADTYHLFHYHGDAFTRLYSEVPQKLNIEHAGSIQSGQREFRVNTETQALVALTLNENIIATAIATNNQVNLNLPNLMPGQKLILTITKQNRLRYQKTISVKSSREALVLLKSFKIDQSVNNITHLNLTPTFENVSFKKIKDVTVKIQSLSNYATVDDNDYIEMGTFGWRAKKQSNTAFRITLSPVTPNQFKVPFKILIFNNNGELLSDNHLTIEAIAPELKFAPTVEGKQNIEPGQTRLITYSIKNRGKINAYNVVITAFKNGEQVTQTSLNILKAGQSKKVSLPIAFSENDHEVKISLIAHANNAASAEFTHALTLQVSEDFELATFLNTDWGYADSAWMITSNHSFQGMFCARSAKIKDNENSMLVHKVNLPEGGKISFYKKVSTEKWDHFIFLIDNTEMERWSGEVEWSRSEYDIPPGEHLLKWKYRKDFKKSGGLDAAFIDNIVIE